MTGRLTLTAVLAGLSLAGITQAQGTRQPVIDKNDAAEAASVTVEQPLFDDDGGRVFIVKRNAVALGPLRYHGGEVISEPQQYNIFLGSAWSDPSLRSRETGFLNLLSSTTKGNEQLSLDSYGVRNVFLPSVNQE